MTSYSKKRTYIYILISGKSIFVFLEQVFFIYLCFLNITTIPRDVVERFNSCGI